MNSSATLSSSTSGFSDGAGLGLGDDFGAGGGFGDWVAVGADEAFAGAGDFCAGGAVGRAFTGGWSVGFRKGDGEGFGEGDGAAAPLQNGRQSARLKANERNFIEKCQVDRPLRRAMPTKCGFAA